MMDATHLNVPYCGEDIAREYWERKAKCAYPTTQNGKLEGGSRELISRDEFMRRLARRIGVEHD